MQNQLLQAATTGNLAEVKRCIENNVPINQKYEPNGYTALHLSVDGGHRQVVQFLVDSGADISVKDAFGKTALHTAVEKTRIDCVSILLQNTRFNKLFINIPDSKGDTALHTATNLKSKELIALLIKGGAEVSALNKENNTPFKMADKEIKQVISDACNEVGRLPGHVLTAEDKTSLFAYIANGDFTYVKLHTPSNLLITNRAGHTPLYVAVQAWQKDIAEYFLSKGAPVNEGCTEKTLKQSPLHYAAFGCNAEMVKLLLDHGANVNAYDFKENTPLHLAAEWRKSETVGLLIDYGADTEMLDGEGLTAMHRAAMFNRRPVVKKLIEKGADPNCRDPLNRTPLHYAAQWGWHSIITILSEVCDMEAFDNNKWTALHYASRWNRSKSTELLLQFVPHHKEFFNSDGHTPYQLSKFYNHKDLLPLFTPTPPAAREPPKPSKRGPPPPIKARKPALNQEQLKADLLKAVKNKNVGKVEEIIDKHGKQIEKNTIYASLFAAVRAVNSDILSAILDPLDLNLKDCIDEQGKCLLHAAVASRNGDILSELLGDDEIPIDHKDNNGHTPLHTAVLLPNFSVDSLKELVSKSNLSIADNNGNTAFHLLITRSTSGPDYLQRFKIFLKRAKAKNTLNIKNKLGESLLHLAIGQDNWCMEMVESLLSSGITIEATDNQNRTPLFVSAYLGKTKIAKFLVMSGASIADSGAGDPLQIGGSFMQSAILEAVEDKKEQETGQANEKNQHNNTKLFADLFASGNLEGTRSWLSSGGDIAARDDDESIPLHIAAYNGHAEIVELLLQYNSDVNAIDKNSQTPLHLAAMKGHLAVVQLLVAANSDLNALDLEYQTPVDWATLMGKSEVAKYLQSITFREEEREMGKSFSKIGGAPKREYPNIPDAVAPKTYTPPKQYKSQQPSLTNETQININEETKKLNDINATSILNVPQPDIILKSDPAKASDYLKKLSISSSIIQEDEEEEEKNFRDVLNLISNGIQLKTGPEQMEVKFQSHKIKGFESKIKESVEKKSNSRVKLD